MHCIRLKNFVTKQYAILQYLLWSRLKPTIMHISESDHITSGLWIIIGIVAFLFIENLFAQTSSSEQDSRKIVGYLNLLANSIDNFIHGLAVASSFLNSFKLGFTTVFAILIHEIPHEIGDFAILLNSGFSRYV